MMWFFLVSDALTFGGLLTAYGVIRHGSSDLWPVGEQVFEALPGLHGSYPLMYVALMTFILIISSVTMVLAVEAGHRMDKKGVVKWLGLTIIGGFFFLGSQAWEWSHFIHGSGGGFQVNQAMTVAAADDAGNTYQITLDNGTWVHIDLVDDGVDGEGELVSSSVLGVCRDVELVLVVVQHAVDTRDGLARALGGLARGHVIRRGVRSDRQRHGACQGGAEGSQTKPTARSYLIENESVCLRSLSEKRVWGVCFV